MLTELLTGDGRWPNEPEGWTFCPSAVIDFLNIYDEANHTKPDPHGDGKVIWFCSYDALALLDAERDEQDQLELAARQRVSCAVDFAQARIGAAAFAGRIPTAVRPKVGGGLAKLDAAAWGMDDCWPRLHRCATDPAAPFDTAADEHWLFFESAPLYREIDAARAELGLEAIYSGADGPDERVGRDKGGKPLNSALWGNLVGVITAYIASNDIMDGTRAGELHAALDDYAAKIGVDIPARTTALPALKLALKWSAAPHEGGKPLRDKDGRALTD